MKWSNIEEWFLSKSNFSEFHSLALFFNTLYFALHPPFILNESNIFCFIFFDAISMEKYDNEAMLFTISLFFSSNSEDIQHSRITSSLVEFKCRYKRDSNLICGCYLWLLFNIRMVFGCWTQWCSKWDSMYEIEKEMCVLCVVWAKVLLLLEIDVIMCLYGQKFWECVCKEGKEKHRQSKKKESGREKWCSPIRPKT